MSLTGIQAPSISGMNLCQESVPHPPYFVSRLLTVKLDSWYIMQRSHSLPRLNKRSSTCEVPLAHGQGWGGGWN